MTQNTEQNVRTREAQIANAVRFARLENREIADFLSCYLEPFSREAEARGAEEQRRKDAEGGLRPMSEAEKNRTPILAKIHDDLFPRIYPERKDLKCWNGRWVVISHTGILADGFDIGWGMAAPVGHGGLTDDWFVGWKPVDFPANVAALEARIAELVEAEQLARADAEASKARVMVLEAKVTALKSKSDDPDDVTCALMDSQYVAGAKFGWNCGQDDDHESLTKMIEGRLRDRIEAGVSFSKRSQEARAALTREGGV